MPGSGEDGGDDQPLTERVLDLLVFAPAGLVLSALEEFPRLAERGRRRFGVRVSSAHAIGRLAVHTGQREVRKRSEGLFRPAGGQAPATRPTAAPATGSPRPAAPGSTPTARPPAARPPASRTATTGPPATRPPARSGAGGGTVPVAPGGADGAPPGTPVPPSADADPSGRPAPGPASARAGHVPAVDTLAIPGYDTLSASQVVQRLDGLTRQELVAVRAFEAAGRGRRTIVHRVDQLLDERS